jgi:hypothetical protein
MSPAIKRAAIGPRTPDVMRKFKNKLLISNLTTQVRLFCQFLFNTWDFLVDVDTRVEDYRTGDPSHCLLQIKCCTIYLWASS